MTVPRLSIAQVNAMDRTTFVAHFGGVYERSPWVAEAAWSARPFADRAALERALQDVVAGSGDARQLELLRLHPRLGTRQPLSGYSRSEQTGAGLLAEQSVERERIERLNREYEDKFGFPFIIAVRGASLAAILDSCATRMNHEVPAEFAESLRQVHAIARFRLNDLVANRH
jgi:2-oxo-4-hydroxy-4-carboxy-5-ureidoimidazoline decarboxylase